MAEIRQIIKLQRNGDGFVVLFSLNQELLYSESRERDRRVKVRLDRILTTCIRSASRSIRKTELAPGHRTRTATRSGSFLTPPTAGQGLRSTIQIETTYAPMRQAPV